jgi:hypothetical protein
MTRERLKRVAKLLTTIVEIKSELDTISREERDKYETLTEAQKQSDRGEQILDGAAALEDVVNYLDDATVDITIDEGDIQFNPASFDGLEELDERIVQPS